MRISRPTPLLPPRRRPRPLLLALLGVLGVTAACSSPPPPAPPERSDEQEMARLADQVKRKAESERIEELERQVARLQADLRHAEESLVSAESGLRGSQTRADAVTSLADARIQVRRGAEAAPWRQDEIAEAEDKLREADVQIGDGHFGAAVFFVYRAERLAQQLQREGELVRANPSTRFVAAKLVNLRSGPSTSDPVVTTVSEGTPVMPERFEEPWALVRTVTGPVGWIHSALLR